MGKLRDRAAAMSARTVLAWGLVVVSGIGWPLTQFTIAKHEAPFTLALSWCAILLTGLDILLTSQVKDDQ